MAEEEPKSGSPHSLKNKIRSSLCLSCCFPHHNHHVKPRIVHSSSLHNKSRSNDLSHHIKEKCCSFMSRIGRHHRRHSADFHYDPLSYSRNFEDDAGGDERFVEDFRCFSARLPPSRSRSQSPSPRTPSTSKTTTSTKVMEISTLS